MYLKGFYGLFLKRIGFGSGNRGSAVFCISSKGKRVGAFCAGDIREGAPHYGVNFYADRVALGLSGQEGVLKEDREQKSEMRNQISDIRKPVYLNSYFSFLISTFIFCFFFLSSCARGGYVPDFLMVGGEKIRVAVLKGVRDLKIGGVSRAEAGGSSLDAQASKDNPLSVVLDETGALTINGSKISGSVASFFPNGETLYLNGRPFRGKIEVIIPSAKDFGAGVKEQKALLVVNELPLELYVAGIINNEISSKWPMEAVKAQAVIARTYALYQKKKKGSELYHLEGTVAGQVYSGSQVEDELSFQAVHETLGEALEYNGEIALTVYHSNGGGVTEDAKNVWGKDFPYLKSVKSQFDEDSPNCYWVLIISQQSVESALRGAGYSVYELREITPLYKTPSNRITRLRVRGGNGGIEISGEDWRKAVGYEKLKSTMFTLELAGGSFVFKGKGAGHGVGLSQWGAKGMAEKGYSYGDILKHFYPGTKLERLY